MEKKDFTEMDVTRALFHIAIPSMVGMAFTTLYNLTDMFWVGRLGYEQIAAIGLFGIFFEFAIVFNEVVGVGSVALIARHYGAKNYQRVNEVVKQTLLLKLLIAAIFCLVGIGLVRYILIALGAEGNVIDYGVAYGRIMSVGFLFMLSGATIFTAMRGVGDARTPMKIMILSNFINIVLDPLFIFTFGLGIQGAAAASVLAQMISLGAGLWLITTGRHVVKITTKIEVDLTAMKNILVIGIPSGFEHLIRNISNMITVRIIAGFGMTALAGFQICFRLLSVGWMPLFGLTLACGTLIGHNLGAKKPEKAERTALKAGYMGAVIMIVAGTIFFLFSPYFVSFFNNTEEVVETGVTFFRMVSPFLVFLGFYIPLSGAFFGSGDTKPPMIVTFIYALCFQIPFMIIFSRAFGLKGAFSVYGVAMILGTVLIYLWFRKGKWKEKEVESK
ncbi:MAG: MATE family efflux transporter [Euryarchaeota archaeon]|nr:MATE family efflux transporter [Euryarchaeota archaeon]